MFTRCMTYWDQIRSSLWALPLAMIAGAVFIAVFALTVQLDLRDGAFWNLLSGASKETLNLLISLMSSMITLATLVVSITMVVLTLAAQQLGPRLIKNFMSDWVTQAANGLFFATIVYLIIILRGTSDNEIGVPNLAVTIGTAMVLLSIVSLPIFLHRLARSINADSIISRVGELLDETARNILPEHGAKHLEPGQAPEKVAGAPIRLPQGGYIQAIDTEGLLKAASDAGALIVLACRPGHHLVATVPYGNVSPASALNPTLQIALERGIIIGRERAPVQDVEFTVRQLVEVAARALSDGINDPYTAIAAIDRLALSLGRIMQRGESQNVWRDAEGAVRLIIPATTFEGLMDAALNEIRQFSGKGAAITIRVAEKLGQLMLLADEDQKPVITKHLHLILSAGRREIADPYDLNALEQRIQEALGDLKIRRPKRPQAVR